MLTLLKMWSNDFSPLCQDLCINQISYKTQPDILLQLKAFIEGYDPKAIRVKGGKKTNQIKGMHFQAICDMVI